MPTIEGYSTAEERAKAKEKKREANRIAWAARNKKDQKVNNNTVPVTTPAGMKNRMQEFKEQLLHAPVATAVIRKVIDIARNDEHPGQMAALKMCLDRMLPMGMFEEKKDGQRTAIQITIGRVGDKVGDDSLLTVNSDDILSPDDNITDAEEI
jgi:hypothetical protein